MSLYTDIMSEYNEDTWNFPDYARESYQIISENVIDEIDNYHDMVESEDNCSECYTVKFIHYLDFCVNGITFTADEIEVNSQFVVFYFNFIDKDGNNAFINSEIEHEDFSDIVYYGRVY